MRIAVTRLDAHRHATRVTRKDGVTLGIPGYAFMRPLPHDLEHYVVETTLDLRRGFWASVAEGAIFNGMHLIDGRRRPHASERATAIIKANSSHLGEAENLVACFGRIVGQSMDGDIARCRVELQRATATIRHARRPIDGAAIKRVCTAWHGMQTRWDALPIGDTLSVDWRDQR
jgi:hypothetical protein